MDDLAGAPQRPLACTRFGIGDQFQRVLSSRMQKSIRARTRGRTGSGSGMSIRLSPPSRRSSRRSKGRGSARALARGIQCVEARCLESRLTGPGEIGLCAFRIGSDELARTDDEVPFRYTPSRSCRRNTWFRAGSDGGTRSAAQHCKPPSRTEGCRLCAFHRFSRSQSW